MKKIILNAAFLMAVSNGAAYAQSHDLDVQPVQEPTLEEQAPPSITQQGADDVLTLVVENDMFASGNDNNYTSGVRLGYLDVDAPIPQWAHHIAQSIPTFSINDTTSVFYSLGHNMYTPDDIESRAQDPDDRPWAGFLYGSVGMVTFTDNHLDEVEVTLGVVGPAALGEQVQKMVHRHVSDSPMPKGWSNQLKNEPALMVGWQRSFPRYVWGDLGTLTWSLTPHFGATLGNVYTYANTGISARIGPGSEEWQDKPMRVRPAMPGTGFFEIPNETPRGLGWSWYLFGGIDGRAVARNIFLDGNTFTDSHSVDRRYFVMDANAGIAFTYGRARLSYTAVYRTKEFDTQKDPEVFGAMSLGYRF